MDDGTEVKALMVDDPKSIEATDDQLRKDGWVFKSLRESLYHLPEPLYLKAGKCEELLYWDHNTQFCGVCGAPMKMSTDISKRCTHCGKEIWPSPAAAVIVAVTRNEGREILLVQSKNFKRDYMGLVAGFVETGETLEEAVRREVREETGLEIRNLRYFDSQPWPFPNVLMAGFTAEYAGGTLDTTGLLYPMLMTCHNCKNRCKCKGNKHRSILLDAMRDRRRGWQRITCMSCMPLPARFGLLAWILDLGRHDALSFHRCLCCCSFCCL